MAHKIWTIVVKEIREATPPMILFLFLFHMIGLTKAVVLAEYSITAMRAAGATIGAILVAKAILVVDALPLARLGSMPRLVQLFWKTLLFGVVVLVFRVLEEFIPLAVKHGGVAAGASAFALEVNWAIFGVLMLWTLGGLFLYCFASDLVDAMGANRVKAYLMSH